MDDLEMCVYAFFAGRLTHKRSPAQTLRTSARRARQLSRLSGSARRGDPASRCQRAEQLSWRWVRLVVGARGDCYDRAVAARWWLARRGVHVHVIIGVRGRPQELEGHAWIEDEQGRRYLVEQGAAYREVSRG